MDGDKFTCKQTEKRSLKTGENADRENLKNEEGGNRGNMNNSRNNGVKNKPTRGNPGVYCIMKQQRCVLCLHRFPPASLDKKSHLRRDREWLDRKEPPLCPQNSFPALSRQRHSQHSQPVRSRGRRRTARRVREELGRLWLSQQPADKASCRRPARSPPGLPPGLPPAPRSRNPAERRHGARPGLPPPRESAPSREAAAGWSTKQGRGQFSYASYRGGKASGKERPARGVQGGTSGGRRGCCRTPQSR